MQVQSALPQYCESVAEVQTKKRWGKQLQTLKIGLPPLLVKREGNLQRFAVDIVLLEQLFENNTEVSLSRRGLLKKFCEIVDMLRNNISFKSCGLEVADCGKNLRNWGFSVAEQHFFTKLRICRYGSASLKLLSCDCGRKYRRVAISTTVYI
jgi:hypothetical protein